MKKFWRISLVVLLSVAVGAGVSSAVYSYKITNADLPVSYVDTYGSATDNEYGFHNTALAGQSRAVGSAPDLIPAAESSVHAVVHIKVEGEQQVSRIDPFEFFFGGGGRQLDSRPVVGYGSGVIISKDGYIITNNHVIADANKIEVTLNDNRTFKATLVGSDPATDIALIKIEAKDLPTLPFGNSDDLRVGEWVLAVGNPFNLTSTVTAGIVSAKARSRISSPGEDMKIGGFIQTDAAVNPGNSGGALVNARGELVGINTMIYSNTGNYAGYSFAVPINTAAKVVGDIKKFGTVQRAVLGIIGTDINKELKDKYNLKVDAGVLVTDFAEVSAAYAAGIEKHDVIVAVDGRRVMNMTEVQEIISTKTPGDRISITVDRKGVTKKFSVVLKNSEGNTGIVKKSDASKLLGASLKELSVSQKRSYGISYGVVVDKVEKGKFRQNGIKEGFIILTMNNVRIQSVDDAMRIVSQLQSRSSQEKALMVRGFYPNGRIKSIVIDLN